MTRSTGTSAVATVSVATTDTAQIQWHVTNLNTGSIGIEKWERWKAPPVSC
jgi:hypothetical protein